jgi:hypothetical protein
MKLTVLVAALTTALAAAPLAAGELDDRAAAARGIVKEFATTLQGELGAAMKAGGPVNAIGVCNTRAPAIAADLSKKNNWKVARTSLKPRNTKNAPDAWETRVLNEFEARKAKGEDPAGIEHAEIVTNGGKREFRYMKAIAIAPDAPCLGCHGGKIDPAVSAKLKTLYPQDQATGYNTGDLRGAFTLRHSL